MKSWKHRILAGLVAFSLLLPAVGYAQESAAPSAEPAAASPTSESTAVPVKLTIEELAGQFTSAYGTTSLQYAMLDDGTITKTGTSGVYSKSENRLLTDDILYGIGSVSKVYTTAAALKLAEQGKLDIDKPVADYLPAFTMKDARYRQITPRMLMNHSSGLNGSSLQNAFLFDDADTFAHDSLLDKLASQTLKADPGAFSVYCNDGFTLLELLIEKVSGMPFSKYLKETFFTPMGLEHTSTTADTFDEAQLAKTYLPQFEQALPRDSVNVLGTGGIYASASDLASFGGLLMGGKPDLLSKESSEKMFAQEYKNGIWVDTDINTVGYGLGWDSVDLYPFTEYGIKAASKGGDSLMYHASLIVLPEHALAVAVTSSGGSSGLNSLLGTKILLEALLEKGIIDEIKPDKVPEPPVQQTMPKELEAFSGYYGTRGGASKIAVADGKITIPGTAQTPAQEYVYVGDNQFKNADGSITLQFSKEKNGHTYLQMMAYATIPGLGSTVSADFNAQKLEPNEITDEVRSAWAERVGKKYYLVNEKATSQLYPLNAVSPIMADLDNGYVLGDKIVSADTAQNILQLPVMSGRDTFDVYTFSQNGKDYLKTSDTVLISEDSIAPIWDGGDSLCTIQPDGYARWYRLPQSTSGKAVSVSVPDGGVFAVYDADGTCTMHSLITGATEAQLPKNGTIVFLGKAGVQFKISIL